MRLRPGAVGTKAVEHVSGASGRSLKGDEGAQDEVGERIRVIKSPCTARGSSGCTQAVSCH